MIFRKLLRSQSGTAMVELGVVLPMIALLLMGVIEVGRYMYFGIVAAHAAEAGAQYGAQSTSDAGDPTGVQSAVAADSPGVTWTRVSATRVCYVNALPVSCPIVPGTAPGTLYYVNVKVTGTFNSLFNYPGVPHQIPVSASVIARALTQ